MWGRPPSHASKKWPTRHSQIIKPWLLLFFSRRCGKKFHNIIGYSEFRRAHQIFTSKSRISSLHQRRTIVLLSVPPKECAHAWSGSSGMPPLHQWKSLLLLSGWVTKSFFFTLVSNRDQLYFPSVFLRDMSLIDLERFRYLKHAFWASCFCFFLRLETLSKNSR